ncbi:MAG: hypothetical protein ACRDVP_00550, partial [Acidimicrobiales bacterium]
GRPVTTTRQAGFGRRCLSGEVGPFPQLLCAGSRIGALLCLVRAPGATNPLASAIAPPTP